MRKIISVSLIALFSFLSFAANAATDTREQNNPLRYDPDPYAGISVRYRYKKLISQGLNQMQGRLHEDAQDTFWEAIFLRPDLPEAYINLGILNMQLGRYDAAMRHLTKANELSSDRYLRKDLIFYNLGLCAQKSGDFQSAIRYYQDALEIDAYLGEALFNLGVVYQEFGDETQAITYLSKAKAVFVQTGNIELTNRTDQLLRQTASVPVEVAPEMGAQHFLEQGSEEFQKGNHQEAIALIQKSLMLDETNPLAYYRLGVIYAQMARYEDALVQFKQVTTLDTHFTKAYVNLGSTYGKLQQYDRALASFQEALQLDPNNASIYYNVGMLYLTQKDERQAKEYFKKARTLAIKQDNQELLAKIDMVYKKRKALTARQRPSPLY